ncbi:MAG: hypothetical protein RMI43_07095 [Candidatus Caldarchaeum sp.]|nr:hypothetical protein [Candidatus Caldarchaeum sp.]
MVSEMLGARIHRKPDILTVLLFFLSAFLVANFLLFASFARLDVGVGSQWLYNVRVGGSAGLAVESYEEKVWLESLTYCEKILCYRIVKTNPTHLHSDYLTGDNRLLRSTIIDKGDGTVYEISYEPPLLMMPMSLSVGDVWQSSSTATVRVFSQGFVKEDRIWMGNVESKVVERLVLSGVGGSVEGFLIEERREGVLTKRMIYSPSVHQVVRYEIPVSVVWGELIDVSIRAPGLFDFLMINMFSGFELRYLLVLTVVLGFLRLYLWLGYRGPKE